MKISGRMPASSPVILMAMNEKKKAFLLKIRSENKARIFDDSWLHHGGDQLVMAELDSRPVLLLEGESRLFYDMKGKIAGSLKICPCSHENRLILNHYFDFTNPVAIGREQSSFGFGDRLGVTTAAHIDSIAAYDIKAVLAQQSKRELALTGRSYEEVLDDVTYAVIQKGYRDGFGADADHLKNRQDIADALSIGYSMITVDCSDVLKKGTSCGQLPESIKDEYARGSSLLEQLHIFPDDTLLLETYAIYGQVITFLEELHHQLIRPLSKPIDLEISLDETAEVTHPFAHFYVANELKKRDIRFTSLAPRFVGEFQKGIDYIGDPRQFKSHLIAHARVADHFGHKISLHSGSDKFSIFRIFANETGFRFHVKTSGTSWLEALRFVARQDGALFRQIFLLSLAHFDEAKKRYPVKASLDKIFPIERLKAEDYPQYLDEDNARQCLHIAYGDILQNTSIRARLFHLLNQEESCFHQGVELHMDRHLSLLERKIL